MAFYLGPAACACLLAVGVRSLDAENLIADCDVGDADAFNCLRRVHDQQMLVQVDVSSKKAKKKVKAVPPDSRCASFAGTWAHRDFPGISFITVEQDDCAALVSSEVEGEKSSKMLVQINGSRIFIPSSSVNGALEQNSVEWSNGVVYYKVNRTSKLPMSDFVTIPDLAEEASGQTALSAKFVNKMKESKVASNSGCEQFAGIWRRQDVPIELGMMNITQTTDCTGRIAVKDALGVLGGALVMMSGKRITIPSRSLSGNLSDDSTLHWVHGAIYTRTTPSSGFPQAAMGQVKVVEQAPATSVVPGPLIQSAASDTISQSAKTAQEAKKSLSGGSVYMTGDLNTLHTGLIAFAVVLLPVLALGMYGLYLVMTSSSSDGELSERKQRTADERQPLSGRRSLGILAAFDSFGRGGGPGDAGAPGGPASRQQSNASQGIVSARSGRAVGAADPEDRYLCEEFVVQQSGGVTLGIKGTIENYPQDETLLVSKCEQSGDFGQVLAEAKVSEYTDDGGILLESSSGFPIAFLDTKLAAGPQRAATYQDRKVTIYKAFGDSWDPKQAAPYALVQMMAARQFALKKCFPDGTAGKVMLIFLGDGDALTANIVDNDGKLVAGLESPKTASARCPGMNLNLTCGTDAGLVLSMVLACKKLS